MHDGSAGSVIRSVSFRIPPPSPTPPPPIPLILVAAVRWADLVAHRQSLG